MGVFLPQSALPGLKKYKYASEDRSLMSKYILKPFYTWLVQYFPQWLAPNLITLLGLLFSIGSFVRAWYYNGDFNGYDTPRWVFFSYAADLFIYQTLDALDGQQARRTGSSSPLGELFDHCVDAINTSLEAYVFSSVMNLPKEATLIAQFLCTLNFFASTWEEYYTHKLFLSEFSGPVEGILMVVGLEILTGYVGPEMWDTSVVGDLTLKWAISLPMSIGLMVNVITALVHIRDTPGSLKSKLRDITPFLTMYAGYIVWALIAWPELKAQAFVAYFMSIAFSFALIVGRIITAHVTSQPFPMWSPLVVIPYIALGFHYFVSAMSDADFALVALGISIGVYGMFVFEVIEEITSYLDIGCFYIKHKPKEKAA